MKSNIIIVFILFFSLKAISQDFTVSTKSNKMEYKIEMKKSEDADFVLKIIRKLRQNKEYLLEKIA